MDSYHWMYDMVTTIATCRTSIILKAIPPSHVAFHKYSYSIITKKLCLQLAN